MKGARLHRLDAKTRKALKLARRRLKGPGL
jgi:hypothetical protein